MINFFGSVRKLLKLDAVSIDNNVFRLHYKVTVVLLLVFSLLVTGRQYVGDPIDCMVDEIPARIMDSFCWIYSTYTIPNRLTGVIGKGIIQPGVGNYDEGKDQIKYHRYYQWVCFALFFQAVLFYAPRYFWKIWEGGRMKMLVMDLKGPIVSNKYRNEQKEVLIDYFTDYVGNHNKYAYKFFICELLNFLNVLFQVFFIDMFLDGEFSTYGPDVMRFTAMEPQDRVDPMARVFPKVTKCTFYKYGLSGSLEKFDGLCVLSLNAVNEKIYVVLWFWFIILTVVTALGLVYRAATLYLYCFRVFRLRAKCRLVSRDKIEKITKCYKIGDWFILQQLCKNLEPITCKEFIEDLANSLEETP